MDLPVNDSSTAAETVVTSRGAIRQVLTHASALRLEDLKLNIGTGPTILVMIAAWFLLSAYTRPSIRIAGAPVVGRRSKWEPDLSLLWRYTTQAREIIGGGAARVSDEGGGAFLVFKFKFMFPLSGLISYSSWPDIDI